MKKTIIFAVILLSQIFCGVGSGSGGGNFSSYGKYKKFRQLLENDAEEALLVVQRFRQSDQFDRMSDNLDADRLPFLASEIKHMQQLQWEQKIMAHDADDMINEKIATRFREIRVENIAFWQKKIDAKLIEVDKILIALSKAGMV